MAEFTAAQYAAYVKKYPDLVKAKPAGMSDAAYGKKHWDTHGKKNASREGPKKAVDIAKPMSDPSYRPDVAIASAGASVFTGTNIPTAGYSQEQINHYNARMSEAIGEGDSRVANDVLFDIAYAKKGVGVSQGRSEGQGQGNERVGAVQSGMYKLDEGPLWAENYINSTNDRYVLRDEQGAPTGERIRFDDAAGVVRGTPGNWTSAGSWGGNDRAGILEGQPTTTPPPRGILSGGITDLDEGGVFATGGPPNPTVPSFGYSQYQDWTRFMPTNFGLAEGGGMHYQPWASSGGGLPPGVSNLGWQSSCFVDGVQVELVDGSEKNVSEISVGDEVKTDKGDGVVTKIYPSKAGGQKLYGFNDKEPFVTEAHPFMTQDGWKKISEVTEGDTLYRNGKGIVTVESITSKEIPEDTPVYNFHVDGHETYFADGYLVHNKTYAPGYEPGGPNFVPGTGPGPINPNIWGNPNTTGGGGNTTTDAQGKTWIMSNGQWIPADSDLGSILASGNTPVNPLGHYDSRGRFVGAEGLTPEQQGVNWAADAHEAMYPGSQQMASDAGFGLLTANRFNPAYRDYRQSNINEMVRLGVPNVLPGATNYNSQNWRDFQTARAADWNNPNVGAQAEAEAEHDFGQEGISEALGGGWTVG